MKPFDDKLLKWELARERFQIEDRFPPKNTRTEQPLTAILKTILKTEEVERNELPQYIVERWPLIAGEQLAQHVNPAHIKDGFLYLYADHSGWLAEFRRLPKAPLLKKIRSIPNIPEVRDIRCQLSPDIRTHPRK